MTRATAPGKFILCGEHAVVYGQPAIAVPLREVHASVEVESIPDGTRGHVHIQAPDINFDVWLHEADPQHPLCRIVQLTLDEMPARDFEALRITVASSIPVASGFGSGAAVSIACLRALSEHLGHPLPIRRQSDLAYEVEKIHHGTPSGIDNTVIAYDQAIFFVRDREPEGVPTRGEFTFVLADTGVPSATGEIVASVRAAWKQDRQSFDALFDAIGRISETARIAIEAGDKRALGTLMNENQELLQTMGVSSSAIENLVAAARDQGANGAKLSGAGVGGNVIALVDSENGEAVAEAMHAAGAVWTVTTEV